MRKEKMAPKQGGYKTAAGYFKIGWILLLMAYGGGMFFPVRIFLYSVIVALPFAVIAFARQAGKVGGLKLARRLVTTLVIAYAAVALLYTLSPLGVVKDFELWNRSWKRIPGSVVDYQHHIHTSKSTSFVTFDVNYRYYDGTDSVNGGQKNAYVYYATKRWIKDGDERVKLAEQELARLTHAKEYVIYVNTADKRQSRIFIPADIKFYWHSAFLKGLLLVNWSFIILALFALAALSFKFLRSKAR